MAEFDLIIRGGTVIDGMRMPRYRADVGVKNGQIAKIGRLRPSDAQRVLDAEGLIVAPGFIDLHTHYDAQIFWDPYCTLSRWHGITSVVIENCGFGFAPVRPDERERAMLTMTRVEAIPLVSMQAGMPWDWVTYPEFLDSLDRTPKGINVLPYVPVNPLLTWVMGLERAKAGAKPTEAEERELRRLLHEAMDAGAGGWSAQRLVPSGHRSVQRDYDGTPMATDVMHDETCLALARVLGERNEGFIQMTLVSDNVKRDAEHYEQLAELSGRPVLYNAVLAHDHFPDRHRKTIAWLERCRARGIRVYGQAITTDAPLVFTFEDWNLFDDSEVWAEATTGSLEEKIRKLSDPARRPALKADRPVTAVTSLEEIFVFEAQRPDLKQFENLTLREVGERMGKDPVDAMLDLALADDLRTQFYAPALSTNIDLYREMVQSPWLIFGVSDGGAHTKFLTAGRYPTETLTKYVREHGMIELEEAHWRLSALPAWCAGFQERGVLREGAPADVIVYDYENLRALPMEIVHDFPGGEWRRVQRAEGYRYIMVNGEVTFEDGRPTGVTPGRVLRYGVGERQPVGSIRS